MCAERVSGYISLLGCFFQVQPVHRVQLEKVVYYADIFIWEITQSGVQNF